ncbi:restriction endonuclease subunit S [Vibrio vulnificus]|nr:restriction endonuclease subunit S [Vibrio vulnificus]
MSDSKLPAGWSEKPLGALVSFQKGRKTDTSKNALNGYARYLGASGLSGKDDGFADMAGAVIAEPSDLLMLWDGERSGLVGYMQQGVVASTVSRLTPTDEIDSAYLYYKLVSLFDWIQARRTGTGVPHVPKDLGKILDIIYPKDTSVQRNIATILRTIDNQIDATQALIEKYTAIKQGMMADLFSRGIDPETKALRPTFEEAPELYQETPLGMLPKGWDVSDLGSISLRVTDGSHQAVSTVENGDIPFLFVSCVRGGKILWDKCSYVSKEDYHLISKGREPRKGDILYTAVGSYGHAALVSEDSEFSFQRHIAYIKPNNQFVDSSFLSEFLNSEQTKSWADKVALGNAQKTVTLGELSKFPIVLPGKIEQENIVDSLQAINEVLESEYASLSKLQQTKQGLMQDLLTGKVSVPA